MVFPSCWFGKCDSSPQSVWWTLDCTTNNLYWFNMATLAHFVITENIHQCSSKWKRKSWQSSLTLVRPFNFSHFCLCVIDWSLQKGFRTCVWDVVRELKQPLACYQGSVAVHNWEGTCASTQSSVQATPSQREKLVFYETPKYHHRDLSHQI